MIRVATVFSGIGAPEEALKQLHIEYETVFACDNGERELKRIVKESDGKVKKDENGKTVKEDITYDEIAENTKGLSYEDLQDYIVQLYDATKKPNLVKRSYFANNKIKENQWYEDVRFIDGTRYANQIDLLVGGSPCQSFSISGRRAGLEDARGTLFFDYARIVKEVKPKAFIFENVPGLLSHDKGNTFKIISDIFDSLGYDWRLRQLNAKDYGIPQNRTRVFVVGFRKDIDSNAFVFPQKIDLVKTVTDFLDTEVPHEFYHGEKGFKWVTNEKNLKKRVSINQPISRTQAANQQFNWCGDMVFIPIEQAEWALTDSRVYVGEYQGKRGVCRKLTPRECLRLMGYGDEFKIVVPEQQMYRQCGNSIVVNVMEGLIEQIIKSGVLD